MDLYFVSQVSLSLWVLVGVLKLACRECVYVLFMFLIQDGTSFKSKYKFAPYFYAATKASLYN